VHRFTFRPDVFSIVVTLVGIVVFGVLIVSWAID
jgi:hypothetical protein